MASRNFNGISLSRPGAAHYKAAGLAIAIVLISLLHYFVSTEEPLFHDILRRLYFFPVALAGIWFGFFGGILAAAAISLLYIPHVVLMWNDMGRELANRAMDIFFICCLGAVTGYFADTERKLRMRYQVVSASLKESYGKLRQQADTLLETEEMLRRADRLTVVGQLTADFAHEIRNPLSSIKGAAEILQDGFPDGDPKREFIEIIARETEQMDGVVRDYLNLARSGGDAESSEKADLSALAQETAAILKAQFRQHDIAIRLNIPKSIDAKGSPTRIRQILLNLFLNAMQAVGDGGLITISIVRGKRRISLADGRESDGEAAILTVDDTGPGLGEETLEKLFTPFYTTKAEGTGLGLAVSKRIANALGGRLEASNREVGGARFVLTLPLVNDSGEK